MSTKYIDNSGTVKKEGKKTEFTKHIDSSGRLSEDIYQPSDFDIVEYLGSNGDIEFFRAKDNNSNNWSFYTGTKGNEFD
tara:strand:+ start:18306 stop:18542 length:237 start_codon:yes stop_codon:yes gene_type:complete